MGTGTASEVGFREVHGWRCCGDSLCFGRFPCFLELLQGKKQRCEACTTGRTYVPTQPTHSKICCTLHTPQYTTPKTASRDLEYTTRKACIHAARLSIFLLITEYVLPTMVLKFSCKKIVPHHINQGAAFGATPQ